MTNEEEKGAAISPKSVGFIDELKRLQAMIAEGTLASISECERDLQLRCVTNAESDELLSIAVPLLHDQEIMRRSAIQSIIEFSDQFEEDELWSIPLELLNSICELIYRKDDAECELHKIRQELNDVKTIKTI